MATIPAPLLIAENGTDVDIAREKSIRYFLEEYMDYIVDHVDWHDIWTYGYFESDRGGCFKFGCNPYIWLCLKLYFEAKSNFGDFLYKSFILWTNCT